LTTNFLAHNINSVLDYKQAKITQRQQSIEEIHSRLMQKKNMCQDVAELGAIQSAIHPKHREVFLKNKDHASQLSEMNALNMNFMDVIGIVSSYRVELGVCLQSLLEGYNSIFVQ